MWGMVIFVFSFGKDTVRVILQMLGTITHHNFESILNGLNQFYIFSDYGYVLVYFITGGLLAVSVNHTRESLFDKFELLPKVELLAILLCYIVIFAIQRYQHAARRINLAVEYGYWLIPTFAATILVLKLLANVQIGGFAASAAKVVGMNTFGIYMLHMAGSTADVAYLFVLAQFEFRLPYASEYCYGFARFSRLSCSFCVVKSDTGCEPFLFSLIGGMKHLTSFAL